MFEYPRLGITVPQTTRSGFAAGCEPVIARTTGSESSTASSRASGPSTRANGVRKPAANQMAWPFIVPHCKASPLPTTHANAGGNSRSGRRSILRAYGGDDHGSSQLVERLDGTVSGGFRCRRMGTEAREKRSRESGRPAKELENSARRRGGRGRERRTAQALGRRMEETTVGRGLRRAPPRRHRAGRDEPARPRKAPRGVRLRGLQPSAFQDRKSVV